MPSISAAAALEAQPVRNSAFISIERLRERVSERTARAFYATASTGFNMDSDRAEDQSRGCTHEWQAVAGELGGRAERTRQHLAQFLIGVHVVVTPQLG